jgi:drug/metabolite transporter (DMT)-like permease
MTPASALNLAANIVFDTAGQMAFKAADLAAERRPDRPRWASLARSPALWMGIAAYLAEIFFWLAFLAATPLGEAVFTAAIGIVAVMTAGRVFFREPLTPRRVAAAALIGVGAALVGWGA